MNATLPVAPVPPDTGGRKAPSRPSSPPSAKGSFAEALHAASPPGAPSDAKRPASAPAAAAPSPAAIPAHGGPGAAREPAPEPQALAPARARPAEPSPTTAAATPSSAPEGRAVAPVARASAPGPARTASRSSAPREHATATTPSPSAPGLLAELSSLVSPDRPPARPAPPPSVAPVAPRGVAGTALSGSRSEPGPLVQALAARAPRAPLGVAPRDARRAAAQSPIDHRPAGAGRSGEPGAATLAGTLATAIAREPAPGASAGALRTLAAHELAGAPRHSPAASDPNGAPRSPTAMPVSALDAAIAPLAPSGAGATAAAHGASLASELAAPLPGVASQLVSVLAPLRPTPAGGHTVTIALEPAGLGEVRATIVSGPNDLVVRLAAATVDGERAVRAALPELQANLTSGGEHATVVLADTGQGGFGAPGDPRATYGNPGGGHFAPLAGHEPSSPATRHGAANPVRRAVDAAALLDVRI